MSPPPLSPSVCEIFKSATISGDINFDHELRGEFKKGWGDGLRAGGGGVRREGRGEGGERGGRGTDREKPRAGRGRNRSEVTELEPTEALQGPLRFCFFLKRLLKQNMFKLHALMGL